METARGGDLWLLLLQKHFIVAIEEAVVNCCPMRWRLRDDDNDVDGAGEGACCTRTPRCQLTKNPSFLAVPLIKKLPGQKCFSYLPGSDGNLTTPGPRNPVNPLNPLNPVWTEPLWARALWTELTELPVNGSLAALAAVHEKLSIGFWVLRSGSGIPVPKPHIPMPIPTTYQLIPRKQASQVSISSVNFDWQPAARIGMAAER